MRDLRLFLVHVLKGKAQQTKGDAKDRFEAERQDLKDDPEGR